MHEHPLPARRGAPRFHCSNIAAFRSALTIEWAATDCSHLHSTGRVAAGKACAPHPAAAVRLGYTPLPSFPPDSFRETLISATWRGGESPREHRSNSAYLSCAVEVACSVGLALCGGRHPHNRLSWLVMYVPSWYVHKVLRTHHQRYGGSSGLKGHKSLSHLAPPCLVLGRHRPSHRHSTHWYIANPACGPARS